MSTRVKCAAALVAATLCPTWAFAQASTYALTLLENPLGGSYSVSGINNLGQVVGTANDANTVVIGGISYVVPQVHAVTWSATGVQTDLGANSSARGINDQGQVAGSRGVSQAWYDTATVWTGGVASSAGSNARLNAINNAGQAVGIGYNLYNSSYSSTYALAAGGAASMPSLGGASSRANDINSSGVAVGASQINVCAVYCTQSDVAAAAYHAVSWQGGVATDLGTLGGKGSEAFGVNDAGVIVGQSAVADGSIHAFSWTASGMVDLGLGSASDVNSSGWIVGTQNGSATLWNGTTAIDLNSLLVDAQGWKLVSASDINDAGWIVGSAFNATTNTYKSFLLGPSAVPEPGSAVLMLLGLVGLGGLSRFGRRGA